jgi:hypothetical protein
MANKRSTGKGSTGTSMGGTIVDAAKAYLERVKRKKRKQQRLKEKRAVLLEAETVKYSKRLTQPWPILKSPILKKKGKDAD